MDQEFAPRQARSDVASTVLTVTRRRTHAAAMIGVVCTIVPALKAVEVSQDHTRLTTELLALTGTALNVLLDFEI